jgi:uncharacterized protein
MNTAMVVPGLESPPTFSRAHRRALGLGMAGLALLIIVGTQLDGAISGLALAGVGFYPLLVLGLLVHTAVLRPRLRPVAGAATVLGFFLALLASASITRFALQESAYQVSPVAVVAGFALACALAVSAWVPATRQQWARVLDIDPNNLAHVVALAGILGMSVLALLPLLLSGEVVLFALMDEAEPIPDSTALRQQLYQMIWAIPLALIAVGYGVKRNLRQAARRLGLERPSRGQLWLAVRVAVALVVAVMVTAPVIQYLWSLLGLPTTNGDAVDQLFSFARSPLSIVALAVAAGVGEELLVRGVLQPRLGIVVSNLFFTAMHALQYHWDALVVVFAIGTAFGLLRSRTNTVVSMIAHTLYDLILLSTALLVSP